MANVLGKDCKFLMGDGASPEAFDEVAKCLVVGPPNRTWSFEDGTFHGQADLAMRNVATLFDEGSIGIEFMYDEEETEHAALRSRLFAATNGLNNYQIDFGGVFTATFAAWVEKPNWTINKGNHLKLTANLKIDGPVTYADVE
jgi:hypothetical protein